MGESVISDGDVVIGANEPPRYGDGSAPADSGGDIVLRTGGLERARITAAGVGAGLLGGAYDAKFGWLGSSLKRTLVAANESFGISALSDSTANSQRSGPNAGDWPYELAVRLAADYPAWTVRWYLWDDTSQEYLAPVTVQTGSGGSRFVRFPGTGFSYQLPSGVVATPPTNLDVSVLVSLDNWTPATNQTIVAHENGSPLRGWWITVATTGRVQLTWSNDGTTLNTVASSVSPVVANGAALWIRATLQVNDGGGNRVIKFFTSPDGATWTQLGTTTTTGGTTTLFNPANTVYNLGARQGGSAELITGNVYEVRLRQGIGPALPAAAGIDAACQTILPIFADQWEPVSSTSPTSATGAPVVAILSSAQLGQGLAYLSNATRLPLLLPDYSLKAVLLATSHNESTGNTDSVWAAAWASWIAAVKARAYEAVVAGSTQNPQTAGSSSTVLLRRAHTMRRDKLLSLWAQLAVPAVDPWQAFLDTGNPLQYVQTDGVHASTITTFGASGGPSVAGGKIAGSQLWANHVYGALFGS